MIASPLVTGCEPHQLSSSNGQSGLPGDFPDIDR
jgi:hypothetical protein